MPRKPVRVTDLATMGKCENLARLKAKYGDRVTAEVARAARRGTEEHRRFERERVSDSRCFVASWALGGDHWATEALRSWRDEHLRGRWAGECFIAAYYALSPWAIIVLKRVPGMRGLCGRAIEQLAASLRGNKAKSGGEEERP